MSENIEPALSAEEWTPVRRLLEGYVMAIPRHGQDVGYVTIGVRNRPEAAIALLNAALPDDDPRKITREKIRDILSSAEQLRLNPEFDDDVPMAERLEAFADALESYLPPEAP